MKSWEQFYNRQLNTPERAAFIEQRERLLEQAERFRRLVQAQVFGGPVLISWSDCDPEPWSKQ